MPRDTAISRSVLSDQVKDRLLQAILAGRYPPGSRIIETRVARELGISQAPVREALRDLEALGIVEIAAFRGARVRRPNAAELLEAYGVRAVLESLAARLAVPRISGEELDELQTLIDEMEQTARAGDTHAQAAADARFHRRIIEIAGNATLERLWRSLEPFSRTYITMIVPGVDLRLFPPLHPPILAALRRRDPELAAEALQRHFRDAGAMLAQHWADLELSEPGHVSPADQRSAAVGEPAAARPSERAEAIAGRPSKIPA
jgi:DNA-binding GntR family transcriptional regulator